MKLYRLLDSQGRIVLSGERGVVGGHRRNRIFGRLDCPAALRALARGGYRQHRVFFAAAAIAAAAGFRPCAVCMPEAYRAWKEARAPGRSRLKRGRR